MYILAPHPETLRRTKAYQSAVSRGGIRPKNLREAGELLKIQVTLQRMAETSASFWQRMTGVRITPTESIRVLDDL